LLLLVQLVAGLADALLEAFCRDLVVHLLHHVGIVFLRTHCVPGRQSAGQHLEGTLQGNHAFAFEVLEARGARWERARIASAAWDAAATWVVMSSFQTLALKAPLHIPA